MAESATLSGSLSGSSKFGPLTPVAINYAMSSLEGHAQINVPVEPTDSLKSMTMPQLDGQQRLFLMVVDGNGSVQVRVNGNASLVFDLQPNAPVMWGNAPDVTQLEFTGNGSDKVIVQITKLTE